LTKSSTKKAKKSKKSTTTKAKAKAQAKVSIEGQALALAIAGRGLDKKAVNVEIIDVKGKVDYADYVVVMSGRSDRQVNAIARGIEEDMKKAHGVMALGVEGLPQGTWVLMDFGEVVVHVFHQDTRGYYDLESLWIDAARVNFEEEQRTA
jgi:ribosome-associated protein